MEGPVQKSKESFLRIDHIINFVFELLLKLPYSSTKIYHPSPLPLLEPDYVTMFPFAIRID